MMRRALLGAAAAGFVASIAGAAPASAVEFQVLRNGRDIGRHRLALRREGEDLLCSIEVELRVGFGPVTFYRYRHENLERWRAGRFVNFASVTDDNGTRLAARAERAADGIAVEGVDGTFLAPAEAWPTTYWYPGFLDRSVWVDTQFGRLRRSRVVRLGKKLVPMGERESLAEHVRLDGELALELWYHERRWVGLAAALPDDSKLSYRLLSEPAPVLASAG